LDYGARYYDARLSRFLSVDPLADIEQNLGWNPYHYVHNNPINMIDPTGMRADWIKQENDDGSVTYIAQQGDSAESLEDQHGIPFEIGNEIIQDLFGENWDNGTPEGQSPIHPGYSITIFAVENSSTESGGGFMDWLGNLFNGGGEQSGGYAIFAHGSRNGWSLDGRQAGSKGKVDPLDISEMFFPGSRPKNGQANSNFAREFAKAHEVGSKLSSGTKSTLPTLGDSIICPSCQQLQDSSHIDRINGYGTYSRKKGR